MEYYYYWNVYFSLQATTNNEHSVLTMQAIYYVETVCFVNADYIIQMN